MRSDWPYRERRFPRSLPRHRPRWWPEGETWPPGPPGDMRHWRRMRRAFLMRAVAAFILLLLLGAVACTGTLWLLGLLGQPGAGWFAPWALLLIGLLLVMALLPGLRTLALPLRDLIDAAGRVEAGDLSASVPVRGPRELRSLGRAFNAMLERLRSNEAQRRRLLADVTHELRTPIAVIQGNLEAMLDGVYPADADHLAPALEETRVLSRLVDDLRTLSLAESGVLELHREPTDLGVLVSEVAATFRAQAEAAGVAIVVEVPGETPLVEVDPLRIREVLANLTANALQHTPAGGQVRISAMMEAAGQAVSMIVADTGRGISPRICRTFSTASTSRRTRLEAGWGWQSPRIWSPLTTARFAPKAAPPERLCASRCRWTSPTSDPDQESVLICTVAVDRMTDHPASAAGVGEASRLSPAHARVSGRSRTTGNPGATEIVLPRASVRCRSRHLSPSTPFARAPEGVQGATPLAHTQGRGSEARPKSCRVRPAGAGKSPRIVSTGPVLSLHEFGRFGPLIRRRGMFAGTNWLGVIVCVVVSVIVGFVWYSRFLFLNPWLAGMGKGPEFVARPNPTNYVVMIVGSFIAALFLDFFIRIMGAAGAAGGLLAGAIVWLGFVASTSAPNAAFAGRGWKVWGIEASNHLVTLLLMGLILAVMA